MGAGRWTCGPMMLRPLADFAQKASTARDKRDLAFVYTAEVQLDEDEARLVTRASQRRSGHRHRTLSRTAVRRTATRQRAAGTSSPWSWAPVPRACSPPVFWPNTATAR